MLKAAQMWAQVRQQGKPTADNQALVGSEEYRSIVATSNPKHLSLFVDAKNWQEI
jgi:hypothetical protein